jgi:hypothetical protein
MIFIDTAPMLWLPPPNNGIPTVGVSLSWEGSFSGSPQDINAAAIIAANVIKYVFIINFFLGVN